MFNSGTQPCATTPPEFNFCILFCIVACTIGKKDHLCPYASAVAAVGKAPQGTLVTFDVGHFDPYVQPTLGQSLAKQLDFLKRHAV
jgi:poly(3-hydroxyalkanoate) synthetase